MSNDMLGVALSEARGPLNDLLEKMSGRDGALWLAKLKRMLREGPGEVVETNVPIWRTVWIGRHKSSEAMTEAIESVGGRISDWGRDILGRTTFAQEPEELELVRATGRELCGDRNATTSEIFAAIKARGGRLCPAEVGPALREQYMDQPKGEWVRVAMEPIVDAAGDLRLFYVGHVDDVRWLLAFGGRPGAQWGPEDVWVFLAPRKP